MRLINENFEDFKLDEFPYDKEHTALGEYHCQKPDGYCGNWYDPICLHQWRSLDGSWLITSKNNKRFLEQNRGDNCTGAYQNVYCCLVHKKQLYADYELKFNLKLFQLNKYCGVAINYLTSRNYDFIGIDGYSLCVFHREDDEFIIKKKITLNSIDKDCYFKLKVGKKLVIELFDEVVNVDDVELIQGLRVALVAKGACQYSDFCVDMTDVNYQKHLVCLEQEQMRITKFREEFPKLKLIKKIDLKNFGSGRQMRIVNVAGTPIFLIAQHQKRMVRDSFARISCLTCFDYNGNILWQKGEANPDNSLISCDLPFQIADVNNDGKLEVIYSIDFEVIICDLLTGKIIKSMPTPVVEADSLVVNNPYYRLNVDAIRVADFSGLGYKSDFIIKDRYHNVWAYNQNMELLWRYNHKNTGHFPYIYDFDNDGKDEMFVGYDLVDDDGKLLFSLPMNTDHTDEIIYARLKKDYPKMLILASGNEGMNICNIDGSVYKHNNIGHAQRISVAKYRNDIDGLQILSTTFWGGNGIIGIYDCDGNLLKQMEQISNGNLITPVNYDGEHVLALLNSSDDGGLINGNLDKVVLFPEDNHPTLCCEVFDIDNDGIDEIICFDNKELWIYKAESFNAKAKYIKYANDSFSNYRGEFLIPLEYDI